MPNSPSVQHLLNGPCSRMHILHSNTGHNKAINELWPLAGKRVPVLFPFLGPTKELYLSEWKRQICNSVESVGLLSSFKNIKK